MHVLAAGVVVATWVAVKNFLHANYTVQADNGGFMSIVVPADKGRTQLVNVTDAGTVVTIKSPIARVNEVSAEQVLRATEGKLLGVQLFGDAYFVVSIVVLDDMTEEEFRTPLWFVALTADELEQQLVLGDKY